MSRDPNERRHRRTHRHPECVKVMAQANLETSFSLAAAMGLERCLHGGTFPCLQCHANRRWNEAATGQRLTDSEFETEYTAQEKP
jgi:hypothetical protein